MSVKFHLDENVSPVIAVALRRRGIDVTTTQDAGLRTTTDLEQLAFAARDQRVLYTQDVDFLALAENNSHFGIVFNHNGQRSVRAVIEFLVLLHECMTAEEMQNTIEFVPK